MGKTRSRLKYFLRAVPQGAQNTKELKKRAQKWRLIRKKYVRKL